MQFRILRPEELSDVPPEALAGLSLPAGSVVAAGIDNTGAIVAVWCAVTVVHLEPLWIADARRRSPFILRRLWSVLRDALAGLGVRHTLTIISPAVPVTRRIADWCGAERVDGDLYAMNVSREKLCHPF
jgi:hypothetical protein